MRTEWSSDQLYNDLEDHWMAENIVKMGWYAEEAKWKQVSKFMVFGGIPGQVVEENRTIISKRDMNRLQTL